MCPTFSVALGYSEDLLIFNHSLNVLIPLFQSLFQKKGKKNSFNCSLPVGFFSSSTNLQNFNKSLLASSLFGVVGSTVTEPGEGIHRNGLFLPMGVSSRGKAGGGGSPCWKDGRGGYL